MSSIQTDGGCLQGVMELGEGALEGAVVCALTAHEVPTFLLEPEGLTGVRKLWVEITDRSEEGFSFVVHLKTKRGGRRKNLKEGELIKVTWRLIRDPEMARRCGLGAFSSVWEA